MATNLTEQLQKEIARVRDDVLPVYLTIGAAGVFAATMMRADLDRAVKALAEQDGVACLHALKALEGYGT